MKVKKMNQINPALLRIPDIGSVVIRLDSSMMRSGLQNQQLQYWFTLSNLIVSITVILRFI